MALKLTRSEILQLLINDSNSISWVDQVWRWRDKHTHPGSGASPQSRRSAFLWSSWFPGAGPGLGGEPVKFHHVQILQSRSFWWTCLYRLCLWGDAALSPWDIQGYGRFPWRAAFPAASPPWCSQPTRYPLEQRGNVDLPSWDSFANELKEGLPVCV